METMRSRWTRTSDKLQLQVPVPVNCSAQVAVPAAGLSRPVVREGDREVWQDGAFRGGAQGITGARSG